MPGVFSIPLRMPRLSIWKCLGWQQTLWGKLFLNSRKLWLTGAIADSGVVRARSEHRCAQDQLPPRCGGFSPRNSAEAVVEAVGFVFLRPKWIEER